MRKRLNPWNDARFRRLHDAYLAADCESEGQSFDLLYLQGDLPDVGMPQAVAVVAYYEIRDRLLHLQKRMSKLCNIMSKRWV